MKLDEKRVFQLVFLIFLAIIGFTISLEIDYQKDGSSADSAQNEKNSASNQKSVVSTPASKIFIPKGMNSNDLPDAKSRGATILTLYCAQCHDLPTPAMHSFLEWPEVLDRMWLHLQSSKNGMLRHIIFPPKKDWKILEKYLVRNGLTPLNPQDEKDIGTPEGQVFMSVCSRCHAAPSPKSHTKREWPRVVLRMKANMLAADIPMPEQVTLLKIIDFLQQHSKGQSTNGG